MAVEDTPAAVSVLQSIVNYDVIYDIHDSEIITCSEPLVSCLHSD